MVSNFCDSSGTSLFQNRRVCGKPEISKTLSPFPDQSKAIFLASLFASIALSPPAWGGRGAAKRAKGQA
jgi:hypothetical protein